MSNALMAALESCSQADLDEIDARITELESELKELRLKFVRQIDSLRAARKIVAIRIGVEPIRKVQHAAPVKRIVVDEEQDEMESLDDSGDDDSDDETVNSESRQRGGPSESADRVFNLLQEEGSMPLPAIAARLKIPPGVVGRIIRAASVADWFEKRNGEVHIARDPSA